ncbi:MAG: PepSY domain-containing protein [Anaerorhabdus sp.]
MKKKYGIMALIFLMVGCTSAAPAQNEATQLPTVSPLTEESVQSADEALQIALTHANLTQEEVEVRKSATYESQGVTLYDVEFVTSTTSYSYEINVATGNIINFYQDSRDNVTDETPSTDTLLTIADVKTIVFTHAGVAEVNIYDLDVDLEQKNGVKIYEVDFESAGFDYEYRVNASTGEVISSDKRNDD